MPLTLQPAVPEDLTTLVPIQYAAFHPTEPLHMVIYPSPDPPTPEVIDRTIARILKTWNSGEDVRWVKVVDEESGEIGELFFISSFSYLF